MKWYNYTTSINRVIKIKNGQGYPYMDNNENHIPLPIQANICNIQNLV